MLKGTALVAAAVFAGFIIGAWLVTPEDRVSSATSEIRGTLGVPAAHAQGSQKAAPKPFKM